MKSSCGIGSWDLAKAVVAQEIAVCPDPVAKPHVVGAFIIQLLTFRLLWSLRGSTPRHDLPAGAGQPRQCQANRSGRGLRIRIAEIRYSAISLCGGERHRLRAPSQGRRTCSIAEACGPALRGSFPQI